MVAAAATACATAPPVEAPGLALKRVVIYRNGVGYFERAGRVDSDRIQFRVRKNEIGDFLATLAVLERGGSSVRSASFPLEVEHDENPAPPTPGAAPAARISDLQKVIMALDGGEHDLDVGYIASTPVWRPSYRLVLDDKAATLQVWGIVQNLSGEDWNHVSLSLIAEAPLAFEASLATPVIPARPTVSDGGDVIAVVPRSETSMAQAPEPPPPAAAPAPALPMSESARASRSRKPARKGSAGPTLDSLGDFGGLAGGGGGVGSGEIASVADYSQRARNLSALAAIALQAGATRYDVPVPVTVPDKSATMVMLLDRAIPGEAISLYAPDDGVPASRQHPFRVARFTNKTGGLLERGPLAIFQKAGGLAGDAFLGQGMTDALPDGATATVPFALERTLAVETDRDFHEEGARIYKIEAGALTIARESVTLTRYKLRNGADRAAKLLLKHPRAGSARLVKPPAGTEDNLGTGSALVPAEVAARASAIVTVDERQQSMRQVSWLDPLADEAVHNFLADKRSDPATGKVLAAAWIIRKALITATDERAKLAAEDADLRRGTEETRNNLKALEKNTAAADLRAKLTARLGADSARLDQVTKRMVEVDLSINEQQVRFADALRGLKVVLASSAD
jgi:hypothetical protein